MQSNIFPLIRAWLLVTAMDLSFEVNLHISALISWLKPPQFWKNRAPTTCVAAEENLYPEYGFEQKNEEFLRNL